MGSGILAQLRCSLWRYYLYYSRQWPWILGTLAVAVLPFAFLAMLKSTVPPVSQKPCHFMARSVSTKSSLNLVQSFVCNLPNNCNDEGEDDVVDQYDGALINSLLNETYWNVDDEEGKLSQLIALPSSISLLANATKFLTHPNLTELMENGLRVQDIIRSPSDLKTILVDEHGLAPGVVDAVMQSRIDMARVLSLVGYRDIKAVVCTVEQLGQFLVTPSRDQIINVSSSLCNLPQTEVLNITRVFVSSIDPISLFDKVSDVLKAIGGYQAESLVKELGSMLASLGRLEALAPLATMLDSLSTYISPMISAVNILYDTGWNSESLAKLMSIAEDFMKLNSTPTTAALYSPKSASVLLTPKGLMRIAEEDYKTEPWKNLLNTVSAVVSQMGFELETITQELTKIPETHSLLMLATALLPELIGPDPLNITRVGTSVNLAVERMVPEMKSNIQSFVPILSLMIFMTTKSLQVANYSAMWVKDLPTPVALHILHTFSNVTLTKNLVLEDNLVNWTCTKSSWLNISEADWITFEKLLCKPEKSGYLYQIEELLRPIVYPPALQQLLASHNSSNTSQLLLDVMSFYKALNNTAHTLFSQPWEVNRKKRSALEFIDSYMGELPPGDARTIEVLEYGINDAKYFLQNMTLICLNLAKTGLIELQTANLSHHIPPGILTFINTKQLSDVADLVSSGLDAALQMIRVMESPWNISDLHLNHHISNIFFKILPADVINGVSALLNLLETSVIQAPEPIPQVLDIMNVSYHLLSQIMLKDSFSEWIKETSPYTSGLLQYTDILPRIIAIPYLWSVSGIPLEVYSLLQNTSAWMMYPCGETTISSFFPSESEIPYLPEHWANLQHIKEQVRRLENYQCANGSFLIEEIKFDDRLSSSVTNLVENMVPGPVNVSSSLQLMKSFLELLMQSDPQALLNDLGLGGREDTLFQELEKSFADITLTPQRFIRMLADIADMMMLFLDSDDGTKTLSDNIMFFMYHARAVITNVTAMLDGPLSLAELLGLKEDYLPLQLIQEGPNGTADFLLQELSHVSVATFLNQSIDWTVWLSEICNKSQGRSSAVSLACHIIHNPQLPALQSDLYNVVSATVTSYQQGNLDVPRVTPKNVLDSFIILINRLSAFDSFMIPDFDVIETFLKSTLQELGLLFTGLGNLQEELPFSIADEMSKQYDLLLQTLVDVQVIVDWFSETLPEDIGNFTSELPPALLTIHNTLNSSWMELLDGLHLNIKQRPELMSMNLQDICSMNESSFQDPNGENGRFYDILLEMCTLFGSLNIKTYNFWHQLEQLVINLRNDTREFSSKQLYNEIMSIVSRFREFLFQQTVVSGSQNMFLTSPEQHHWELPSYMQLENWKELLLRISERELNITMGNNINLYNVLEYCLKLVTREDEVTLTNVLRIINLQSFILEKLMARTLFGMLKDYPVLRDLYETITFYTPFALKDVFDMIYQKPLQVAYIAMDWLSGDGGWKGICQLDLSELGRDFNISIARLCSVDEMAFVADIRRFFHLEVFEGTWQPYSLNTTISNSLDKWKQLQLMIENGTYQRDYFDAGLYLGLEQWRAMPSLVFNVSFDTLWENSTMILATLLQPLVSLSNEQSETGIAVKNLLKELDKSLRLARFFLALGRGGDLWKSLREAYVDKPLVSRFFDVIQDLPQFTFEYIEFFGNYSMLSQALYIWSDTACNIHLFLLNGYRQDSSYSTLSNVLEFFCDQQQISLLPGQLLPASPPVIGNTTMDIDAATLAMLLDYVGWDAIFILEGNFWEGPIQVPSWANTSSWLRVTEKLNTLLSVSSETQIIQAVGLGLDVTRLNLGDQFIVPLVSAVYHIANRLHNSINNSTREIDLNVVFDGLGRLEMFQESLEPLIPDLIPMALWFRESRLYHHLMTGAEIMKLYTQMCDEGVQHWLLHPYLSEDKWALLHMQLCPQDLPTVEDLDALTNSSEITIGMTFDWLKIGQSVRDLVMKLQTVRYEKIMELLSNNSYTEHTSNLNIPQKIVQEILSNSWLLQKWMTNGTAEEKHSSATSYLQALAALKPITSHSESLYIRMMDLDMFKELLREYALVMMDIMNGTMLLNYKYNLELFRKHHWLIPILEALSIKISNYGVWGDVIADVISSSTESTVQSNAISDVLLLLTKYPVMTWPLIVEKFHGWSWHQLAMLLELAIQMTPGLLPGFNIQNMTEAYHDTLVSTSHYELLSEFRVALVNLTGTLFPPEGLSVDFSTMFYKIFSNVLKSIPELVAIGEAPTCQYFLSGEQWNKIFSTTGQNLLIIQRHIQQWDTYSKLICHIQDLDLTDVIATLLQDMGWRSDVRKILVGNYPFNSSLNCPFSFTESLDIQRQVISVISDYAENSTATTDMLTCLTAAANSTAGLQFRGLMAALGGLFDAGNSSRKNMNVALTAALDTMPGSASSLKILASRITVMVPFHQVLATNFENSLDFPPEIENLFMESLWVDVNRLYGSDSLKLSKLLISKETMEKLFMVKEEFVTQPIKKRQASKLDMLMETIRAMGEEDFAGKILSNLNHTYLRNEIDNLRMEALLSSEWLMPIMGNMNSAVQTLSRLGELEAILDLNKIITGEVDAVTFLTESLQLMQVKLWSDLAENFRSILEKAVPVITGSELSDDLQRVIGGVDRLQNVINLAVLDFTIPTKSLISNWSDMEKYLKDTLGIDADIVRALEETEINLMELMSLQDVTLEEVICQRVKMESIVTLPVNTSVTLDDIGNVLCNASNAQGLATTFLQHLDIAPLISLLTKFGINTTLASYGMTLEELIEAAKNLEEASLLLPELAESMRKFKEIFQMSEKLQQPPGAEEEQSLVDQFSSPEFLKQAGKLLCGQPLQLIPDSLGILKTNFKNSSRTPNFNQSVADICSALEEDIRLLPGGRILLHFIKPLMDGKIFYTPDNAVTAKIIAEANKTFEGVHKNQLVLKSLQELSSSMSTSQNNSDLQMLEDTLRLPWLEGMMQQLFPSPDMKVAFAKQIKQSSPGLKEIANMSKDFTDILSMGTNLLSCIKLERFVPVNNEEEMTEEAKNAVSMNKFLAGIVFHGVGQTGDTEVELPKGIKYSIRVDYEKTPSTSQLGPRFWRPRPYANMAVHMKYHQGFLLLQEMVDQAILQLQVNENIPAMSYFASALHARYSYADNVRRTSKGRSSSNRDIFVSSNFSSESLLSGFRHSVSRYKRQIIGSQPITLTPEEAKMILDIPIYTKQQPYPCYDSDRFMEMLNASPVLSLVLSFITFTIFIVFLIQQLVTEKKSRNKQVQEVMGLKIWLDHLVWFFYAILLLLLIVLLLTLIIKFGGLQPKAHFGILFAFLLCYGISLIAFCYLVSSLIVSPVLAVFVGVMSTLIFNVPFITISVLQTSTPLASVIASCILPSSAFGFGYRIICQFELLAVGIHYGNIWTSPVRGSELTLGLAIVMLLVDTVLFFVLAVVAVFLKNGHQPYETPSGLSFYLIQCHPSTPAAYCDTTAEGLLDLNWPGQDISILAKSTSGNITTTDWRDCENYYMKMGYSPKPSTLSVGINYELEDNIRTVDVDPGVKQSLRKGLSIVGLRRIYQHRGRSKVAVDNLSLELYEGQIFALLGHNGAGKTTTISIITREVEATAGNVQVYGHDIRTSWNKARSLIGLCPQEAVLFPFLTVQEILLYYSILKGTPSDRTNPEVNMVLIDMGLFNHRHYLGSQLSEGLRRRVCLAVAFVGGSKLIILDEPTSGVDPAARSAIWEVISNNRSGKTILLTTHHLDEAETLADRVAIMHRGQLLCVGSPLSLKAEYGSGYSITLSNRLGHHQTDNARDITQSMANMKRPNSVKTFANVNIATPNTSAAWALIKKYVPNAKLLEALNGEVTYSVPFVNEKEEENRIAEMFEELEHRLEEIGFGSFEIRPTSLEDVVIALNAINSIEGNSVVQSRVTLQQEHEKEEPSVDVYNFKPHKTLDGHRLTLQRLRGIFLKRFLSHSRSWVFYVQMFLLPLVFIILAMIGSIVRPFFEDVTPLTLSPILYGSSATFIRTLDSSLLNLAKELVGEGTWDACPSYIAHSNPGLPSCNVTNSDIESKCLCGSDGCWVDVTNESSLNSWLLATRWKHVQNRYGGISLGIQDPRVQGGKPGAIVWYDNAGYHALPSYMNLFNNARLKRLLGDEYNITTVNHPIKFSSYSFSSMSMQQRVADIGIGLLILVSLTVVVSATAGYVVAERVRGERRVLYVSGLSHSIYWSANMIWDAMVLLINILLTAIVLLIFNQQQFVARDNLAAFVLLAILYGLSMLPIFYLVEGLFNSETVATLTFFSTSFGTGLVTTLILITCQFYTWVKDMEYDTGSAVIIYQEVAAVIKYVFLIFPPFTFACGIKDLAIGYTKTEIFSRFGIDTEIYPFTWDPQMQGGLGVHYLALALWAVIATVILHCWRACIGPLPQPPAPAKSLAGAEEDKDVAAERIKIQCGGASLYDTVLRMVGLSKDFSSPPSSAVSNLFLALRRGECFSLLGLNGAGKTTTFRCVTGDLRPSRGQILINGQMLHEALSLPRPIMGYCPQNHALDPNLTPREMLSVMALIRGFPASNISPILDKAIEQMGLLGEHNSYIRQLSGGTKRKVSTALALLGNPLLVLLDEPTTGLDPASRRGIWSAIRSVTQDGRTVLLTSHSMDEVNILSHRLAIMVNGYFVCMGSPHYLKNKLGNKYTIRLKTNSLEDMTSVVDFLRSQLSDILLKEQHHLSLVLEVTRKVPLRLIFDTLNTAKSLGVTDYDVSQTTLDEVFRVLTSYQGDGQLPPPALESDAEQAGLPMHLSSLHPAGVCLSPEPTFQKPDNIHTPSRMPSVNASSRLPSVEAERPEAERSSFYDNVVADAPSEIYATVGKPRSVRPPSPDIDSLRTESGSAEDSPEEEWTHL